MKGIQKERKYVKTFTIVAFELKDHSNFFTFLSPVQIFHNGHPLVRKREGEKKKTIQGEDKRQEVLGFLRLTLQYSSIGIRRLTATSRMWLRRKRILPAEDKSAHSVERQR